MSQHDYVIDNQSGANFRQDLNNGLSAIVSNNSGPTEPTSTFAYMLWTDTTSGWVKQRNSANTAWIKRFPTGTGAYIDVASAASVDLTANSVSSDYIRITGTTTITSISLEEGQKRTVLAGGIFTVTNSSSIIVTNGVSHTTTVGDVMTIIGETSGVVRVDVGGRGQGATGAAGNYAFFENDKTITANYTITSGKNALTAGPVTINDGVTVTIPDGSTWSIV